MNLTDLSNPLTIAIYDAAMDTTRKSGPDQACDPLAVLCLMSGILLPIGIAWFVGARRRGEA